MSSLAGLLIPRMHHTPAHRGSHAFDQRLMREQNLPAVDHAQQQGEEDQQNQGRLHHALSALV